MNNTQTKNVKIVSRRGMVLEFTLFYKQKDRTTPRDVSAFTMIAQLSNGSAFSNPENIVHTFSETPDADGNKMVLDLANGIATFHLSGTLMGSLDTNEAYTFQANLRNPSTNEDEEGFVCAIVAVINNIAPA